MADPKHEEDFKVVDRRLFTESGELRKDAVEQEKREEEASRKDAAGQTKTAAKTADGAAPPAAKSAGIAANADGKEEPPAAEPIPQSREFGMLVNFITQNAAAMLGGIADPRTGQAFLDLDGAREMIDMLDVLREKTKGNLSKEDDQLLIEVLGSLKLTFMEVSKAAAEAMAKKAQKKK